MSRLLNQKWGLTTLAVVTVITMSAAAWIDRSWTIAFGNMRWPWLEAVMGRSLFEGDLPGANDPVIALLLAATFVYYMGWRNPDPRKWAAWRPLSGFILVAALVTAVYFVHGCKWALGRARPDLIVGNSMPFSHWFTFGPHFITDGIFSGSFPSGHTSQMFILMTVAYVLAGDPLLSGRARQAGILWAAVSIILSLAMGLARCMTLSHWITDILGSILIGWIIMHLLYFHILRVPAQRRFMAGHRAMPEVPEAWEIILCIHLLIGVLGAVSTTIGIRSILLHKHPLLAIAAPAGAAGMWFAWHRASALLHGVWGIIDRESDHDTTAVSK